MGGSNIYNRRITLNADIKRRWVEALRSGRYPQHQEVLNQPGKGFCCLGVLCEIAVEDDILVRKTYHDRSYIGYVQPDEEGEVATHILTNAIIRWAGLSHLNSETTTKNGKTKSLTAWNDSGEASFNEIADMIEEQL
jgi:hypothetical protein